MAVTIRSTHDDSTHQICNIELKNGAKLHRFYNAGGVPYSAIYLDDEEIWSCERYKESKMIKEWNNG